MAHHGQSGAGGSGLESTTPRIGILTGALLLVLFGSVFWLTRKHPRQALMGVGAAAVLAVVIPNADVIGSPILMGVAVITAWHIATRGK